VPTGGSNWKLEIRTGASGSRAFRIANCGIAEKAVRSGAAGQWDYETTGSRERLKRQMSAIRHQRSARKAYGSDDDRATILGNLNDAISNAKRHAGVPGELEAGQRRDGIDIFSHR